MPFSLSESEKWMQRKGSSQRPLTRRLKERQQMHRERKPQGDAPRWFSRRPGGMRDLFLPRNLAESILSLFSLAHVPGEGALSTALDRIREGATAIVPPNRPCLPMVPCRTARQILSSASTTIVRTFMCESFEDLGGARFLKADYSLSCDTREYRAYRAYASLMILVS